MGDLRLGVILDDIGHVRDAAHVAVVSVVAAERLTPGARIGFVRDGDTEHVGVRTKEPIGVVDPFLDGFVKVGQRFWMLLFPQSVSALRHDWKHPAFECSGSQQYLHEIAKRVGLSYEALLGAAREVQGGGDRIYAHDSDSTGGYIDSRQFWDNYEQATGETVRDKGADLVEFCCS